MCIRDRGLSLVSKLSPPRLTALLMGGWFLATSIGNKLSGILASLWDRFPNKVTFFLMDFGLVILALLIYLFMLRNVRRVMKERGIS